MSGLDHQDCRRAVMHAEEPIGWRVAWWCYGCDTMLAHALPGAVVLEDGFERLSDARDGLPAYAQRRGHEPRGGWEAVADIDRSTGRPSGSIRREKRYRPRQEIPAEGAYVYCPGNGCGRGQHVHPLTGGGIIWLADAPSRG